MKQEVVTIEGAPHFLATELKELVKKVTRVVSFSIVPIAQSGVYLLVAITEVEKWEDTGPM